MNAENLFAVFPMCRNYIVPYISMFFLRSIEECRYCSEKAIAVTDHFQKLPVLPAKKLIDAYTGR